MAYHIESASRGTRAEAHLPRRTTLKNGQVALLDLLREPYDDEDVKTLHATFSQVVDEQLGYPQVGPVTLDAFKAYYLSDDVFVLRSQDALGEIFGAFYIKPNFPGRCSHICNHGFMVPPPHRNKGVGTVLAKNALWLSKLLGYEYVYYNLVFTDNTHAIHAYKKLGFEQTGFVPRAGRVTRAGVTTYQDAVQLHFDLRSVETEPENSPEGR